MSFFLGTQRPIVRLLRLLMAALGSFLLFEFISLYLSWPKQAAIGGLTILLALLLNRMNRSQMITIALMLISLSATLRYGWWRVYTIVQFFSDESNSRFTIDSVLMLVLLSAEAYTILIMVLGFMQTSQPLHRPPIPLPADEDKWPHVDVLVPTYNEPLSLVRYTALAAINIDYPIDKLHVYILDDGSRADFKAFAEEAGVGYITRKEHNHAKAGNINHALTKMNSALVAIFDCDHVPTRSFLQVTVGWFLVEQKLGLLQTPHFFYSPDPFERNLLQYKSIPNEGELFYGIIQDGNDLWNATFFCGSCAVIRRKALDEVGGIATETVTEDAHTSLRIQKRGWNTAYVNLPQAAGLATETLAAHVGQRVRWARGMIQILRTDNPLLASGMKISQRLCYFNAMLHFLYAVPRLVFLCAPLVYMLGGRAIIPGYWAAILAYALPHLVLSSLTNSRVQGKHRHSFWNEIYETVLAPYILIPTFLALINPKLGKFNVTDKGNTLAETRFDRRIAAPTAWLLFANFLGICAVPYRLRVTDPHHPGTVISNLVWILFNMVILGVAAAVANEQMQRRSSVRIPARLLMKLHSGEQVIEVNSIDMSVGGAAIRLEGEHVFSTGDTFRVSFPYQTGEAEIPATVVGVHGSMVRLQFVNLSLAEQETLTVAIYSRADSWIQSRHTQEDRPLLSLLRVVRLSFTGLRQVIGGLLTRSKSTTTAGTLLLLMLLPAGLRAQIPGALPTTPPSAVSLPANTAAKPQRNPEATSNSAQGTDGTTGITLRVAGVPNLAYADATERITLKQMGVQGSAEMHGPHSYYSVGFVLPSFRIAQRASFYLSYHFSPKLVARASLIKISLNRTPIADVQAPSPAQAEGEYGFVAIPLPAELLVRNNELTFEFTGGELMQVESTARHAVLANIGATSTLLVASEPFAPHQDLGLLPLPFFDPKLQIPTKIPFVFFAPPSARTLQAAAVVASWFGTQVEGSPVRFSTSIGSIPAGNAVLFGSSTVFPASLGIPAGGPSLSVIPNPNDAQGSLLVVAGDDEDQLLNVARALSLMTVNSMSEGQLSRRLGDSVRIGAFGLPAERQPDDAPRWLPTDKLVSLWSLSSQAALQSDGSKSLPLYFRVPPDLHYGEAQNLLLNLTYRYNGSAIAPGSAMRVYTNGTFVTEVPLPPTQGYVDAQRRALLPVVAMRPFSNTMLINFDFTAAHPDAAAQSAAEQLSGAILRNSYLDLRGYAHWAKMPNLELFSNAGFPFTRKADLGETVVIVPTQPTPEEISLLFTLMAYFASQTGYPALRVEVSGPEAVMRGDRDYLVLGMTGDQPAFNSLDAALPVTLDQEGVHPKPAASFSTLRQFWRRLQSGFAPITQPANGDGIPDVMLQGLQSPYFSGRSIVMAQMTSEGSAEEFTDAFLSRAQSSDIKGNLSLLRNGTFISYTLDSPEYHVGALSEYGKLRIWLAENIWLLLIAVIAFSLLLATYVRDYLRLLAEDRLRLARKPA